MRTTAIVLLVTGLVLLIGVWAATSGPDRVFEGDGPSPDRISTETPEEPTSTVSEVNVEGGDSVDPDTSESGWAAVLARILLTGVLVLLGVGAAVLLWALWRDRERWRVRERRLDEPDFDVLDDVGRVEKAIADDAVEQRALLADGSPRNAIVACWERFERQAETAGVPRRSWETSTEFAGRLLLLVAADAVAVDRLARLYRQARFSDHDVTEADRAAALAALDLIHAGLSGRRERG